MLLKAKIDGQICYLMVLDCISVLRSFIAASSNAPPAPLAAAGVGLVTPPKIEPNTAIINTTGGTTTLITSIFSRK